MSEDRVGFERACRLANQDPLAATEYVDVLVAGLSRDPGNRERAARALALIAQHEPPAVTGEVGPLLSGAVWTRSIARTDPGPGSGNPAWTRQAFVRPTASEGR